MLDSDTLDSYVEEECSADRSDYSDEFVVPLDDPNEEITEQWQDDLHDWYTCRNDHVTSQKTFRLRQHTQPKIDAM